MVIEAAIQVAAIAAGFALCTTLLNKKLVNQKRMKEIKTKVNDFQKRYTDAKKNNDTEKLKQLDAEQKEVMGMTKEMMMSSFKPTIVTIVPALVILGWMNGTYSPLGNIIDVPIIGLTGWFWWYFIISITTALSIELIYKVYTKMKEGKGA